MFYKDNYDPSEDDLYSNGLDPKIAIEEAKKLDRGYNKIFRKITRSDGRIKRTKIEFYTSSGTGFYIRDAETGEYFTHKVGSVDEDLYFKVGLCTGECKSSNGTNSLFFTSPQRYMTHMHSTLDPKFISAWEEKRNFRVREMSESKKTNVSKVISVR